MGDSYWMQTTPHIGCPSLKGAHKTDIVVIGAGLTGLHAALNICEEIPDKQVTLIEADRICGDASGRTMGKVAVSHSRIFPRLSAEVGRGYLRANQEGFNRIEHLIASYDIECDYRRVPNYIFATTEAHAGHVRKDYDSMAQLGLDVEWFEPQDNESKEIPLDFLVSIRHKNQAMFHPRKFALGLFRAILDRGGVVFEHTRATEVEEHLEGVTIDIEGGGCIEAEKAVVATRVSVLDKEPYATALSFWRSHMVAYSCEKVLIKNAYTRYDPVVTTFRSNNADLILGGNDANVPFGNDEDHYRSIDSWMRQAYPEQGNSLAKQKLSTWWGEDADSADRLPLIGPYQPNSKHVFVATGYCGWGMTKSAYAGIMLADLVAGRDNPYLALFDPARF